MTYLSAAQKRAEECEKLFLKRVHHWILKCGKELKDRDGHWIYNSTINWQEQFPMWSLYRIKKIIKSLEEKKVLISERIKAKKWDHTKWYTIDYHHYNSFVSEKKIDQSGKRSQPILSNNNNKTTEDIKISSYTQKKIWHDKEIAKKMIDIWNEEFQYSLKPIEAYYHYKTQVKLCYLYRNVFNKDLDAWRKYAQKVNSSKFLMGEKKTKTDFKASFIWLLRKETVNRVWAGEYGVGDRMTDKDLFLLAEKHRVVKEAKMAEEKIQSSYGQATTEQWSALLRQLNGSFDIDAKTKTRLTEEETLRQLQLNKFEMTVNAN